MSLSPLQHGMFVLVGLLSYVMVTRIGGHHRHPSAAIAWVLLIALLPYLGLPLFLVFGTRKLVRPARRGARPDRPWRADGPEWALQLLAALDVPKPVRNRSIEFHGDGAESLRALLDIVARAQERVDVCTYAVGDDEVGRAVLSALVQAAQRGVRVRVLLDAIGGLRGARRTVATLHATGVELRWFMPVLRNPVHGRTNLRDHRKLVVADGRAMWSGGRNLAAAYFDDGDGGWIDLSFVVRGPLALQAQDLLERDWQAAHGRVVAGDLADGAAAEAFDGPPAQLVPSGPDLADDTLYALLVAAAFRAERRIVAVTPYFVPEDALLAAWCVACRRGVRIDLVVPSRSNHRMADLARGRGGGARGGARARPALSTRHPARWKTPAV
ncbi:MAG: phospholipase D-like domain-containing protein [Burkholderiaceae bacterium]|nr:phospholipase D-like domain-containing protein [Burkholderiaceae bacterium]